MNFLVYKRLDCAKLERSIQVVKDNYYDFE